MSPSQIRKLIVWSALLAFGLWLVSALANFVIEYNWWREIGQVDTWIGMLGYSIAPAAAGTVLAFIALWVAHARGIHFAGVLQKDYPPIFTINARRTGRCRFCLCLELD